MVKSEEKTVVALQSSPRVLACAFAAGASRQVSSGVPQYLAKDYIIGLTQNVANCAVKLLVLFIAFVSDVKVYIIGLATDS